MQLVIRRFFAAVARTRKPAYSSFGETGVVEEDHFRLSVRAGRGGKGLPRFNGVGGDGGDVYVVGKPKCLFRHVRRQLKNKHVVRAENGENASQIKLMGQKGKDTTLFVPIGVEVVNKDRHILLARCTQPSQRHMIAKGGQGGCVSNAYQGTDGDSVLVDIHLKLRPNVGLVGFPNAGKSTLLKALAPKKKVKIASYPFTTTKPQLCFMTSTDEKVRDCDEEQFTLSIADLPGLIEGASKNRGQGTTFLKHLEYSDILLFIVDINGFQLSPSLNSPYRSALETIAILNSELEAYDPLLLRKPVIAAINKIDLSDGAKKAEELTVLLKSLDWVRSVPEVLRPRTALHFDEVVSISAKKGILSDLPNRLENLLASLHPLTDSYGDLDEDSEGTNVPRLV